MRISGESTEKFLRKPWEIPEKVLRKFSESPQKDLRKSEKVIRKSWESPGKVLGKSWESPEKCLRKSWESHWKAVGKSWESPEKVLRKSWENRFFFWLGGQGNMENLWEKEKKKNQPPKYRDIKISFVGLGGEGESGVWQKEELGNVLFNRPVEAGAVLQRASSLTDSLIYSSFSSKSCCLYDQVAEVEQV